MLALPLKLNKSIPTNCGFAKGCQRYLLSKMANLGPFTTHLVYMFSKGLNRSTWHMVLCHCTVVHNLMTNDLAAGWPSDLRELWKCWEIERNDPPESERSWPNMMIHLVFQGCDFFGDSWEAKSGGWLVLKKGHFRMRGEFDRNDAWWYIDTCVFFMHHTLVIYHCWLGYYVIVRISYIWI